MHVSLSFHWLVFLFYWVRSYFWWGTFCSSWYLGCNNLPKALFNCRFLESICTVLLLFQSIWHSTLYLVSTQLWNEEESRGADVLLQQVKLHPRMLASYIRVPGMESCFYCMASFLLMYAGRHKIISQVLESLLFVWETQMEFCAPAFRLVQPQYSGHLKSEPVDAFSFPPSLTFEIN